jgi:hypothetical protein
VLGGKCKKRRMLKKVNKGEGMESENKDDKEKEYEEMANEEETKKNEEENYK